MAWRSAVGLGCQGRLRCRSDRSVGRNLDRRYARLRRAALTFLPTFCPRLDSPALTPSLADSAFRAA